MFEKVIQKTSSQKNIVWLLLFSIVYIAEFILFKNYITREIIEFYPTAFDQTNYLKVAYTAYENMMENGFLAGLKNTSTANSILFIPQAVVFFLIFGATRFNALLLNFIYFLLLQTSIVYLIRWLSGQYFMAAVAIGILLSVSVPFHLAGGIIDFRMDFMTICVYGMLLISILRSDVFLDTKWSIVASVVAAYMILTRCLTSTYVLVLIGTTFLYFLIQLYRSKDHRSTTLARLKNIVIFSVILGISTLPFLWIHRDFLFNYYVTLAGIKETGFRNQESQTLDFLSIISYYPNSVFLIHLGVTTLKMLALLAFLSISCFFIKTLFSTPVARPLKHVNSLGIVNFFLVLSFIIPLIILTFYPSKSPSVASITIVPVILFFVINATAFLNASSASNKYLFLLTAVFLSLGLYYWWGNLHTDRGEVYRSEAKKLNHMYDEIGEYIELNQWNNAYVSTDQMSDYLSGLILSNLYYERHKKLLPITTTSLGNTAFSITESEAKKLLLNSDIYITNAGEYPTTVYPFNNFINTIRPTLNKIAAKNFITLGVYKYKEDYHYHLNHYFHVYAKPDFVMSGTVNNAIHAEGLMLMIPWQVAVRTPKIIINGKSQLKNLKPFQLTTKANDLVNATLSINNYDYQITLVFNQKPTSLQEPIHINLQFPDTMYQCINKNEPQSCLYAPTSKKIILS